ncbi:hypothetical protein [Streptomyces sp. NPDC005438]|uniref:hypothetical protein n=1 Tax=Streptomyces sp. NPDC005438 TaxID=3156880 RepID=UPI0033B82751
MTCDRLVCAHCAGPVSEGRCPVCRAERARYQEGFRGVSATALAALLTAILAVALVAQRLSVA